jgi:hypothetical protein
VVGVSVTVVDPKVCVVKAEVAVTETVLVYVLLIDVYVDDSVSVYVVSAEVYSLYSEK